MSRMFPRAVAGNLLQSSGPRTGDMVVTYQPTPQTMGLPHEVSLSTAYVTEPDHHVRRPAGHLTALTGRATFVCPVSDSEQHTFEVVGTPAK